MPETNEIRRSHFWEFTCLADLSSAISRVYCYRGIVGDGAFMDTDPGKANKKEHYHRHHSHIHHLELYSELCTIRVDLSHLWNTSNIQTLPKRSGPGVYYEVYYEIVMLFGGTEIEAQLCWNENVRSIIFENCLLRLRLIMPIAYF